MDRAINSAVRRIAAQDHQVSPCHICTGSDTDSEWEECLPHLSGWKRQRTEESQVRRSHRGLWSPTPISGASRSCRQSSGRGRQQQGKELSSIASPIRPTSSKESTGESSRGFTKGCWKGEESGERRLSKRLPSDLFLVTCMDISVYVCDSCLNDPNTWVGYKYGHACSLPDVITLVSLPRA